MMNPSAPVSFNSFMGVWGLFFLSHKWLGRSCFRYYYHVLKEVDFQDAMFNTYSTVNQYNSVLILKSADRKAIARIYEVLIFHLCF